MASKRHLRKVSNMLVDTRFQLKYTAVVMLLALAIFSVLGWLYYNERRTSTELLDVGEAFDRNLALPGDGETSDYVAESLKELEEEMEPEVATRDATVVYAMLGAVAFLVLFLAGAGIYVTHKMAGPLYALENFIRAVREGRWESVRHLRRGDEFRQVGEEFKALAETIRSRHGDELAALETLLAEHGEALPEAARKQLEEMAAWKKEYIHH
jgi:TfoX/Sxy family transcriptional regulator of competence genes